MDRKLLEEPAHVPYVECAKAIPKRIHHFLEKWADKTPDAPALWCEGETLTYIQLEQRSNRLAHLLRNKYGAGPEKTIGVLLERGLSTYITLVGILKSGAAYVPFDAAYPTDRVGFIAGDASLMLIITSSTLHAQHRAAGIELKCPVLEMDQLKELELATFPSSRPHELAPRDDTLAYIIYTSGTTGKPKGVAVPHFGVCAELWGITDLYSITARDRCYQGITIAFDFAVEEMWVAWVAGAILIAGTDPKKKVGPDLAKFLIQHNITVFGGVPTLLATLDQDIPSVRCLIVGGEHCPAEMVERWCKPGRQMFNTYGPTETTITSSAIELRPGKPVTIGFPLPGYTWYVLDDNGKRLPDGETGEIVIGGIAVTRGYVNRPDLTAEKFVPDPFIDQKEFGISNPRMYRSGDRGRINPENGEMEIMGRQDDQIKLRGYRFELQEIVSLLLEDPAIANAAVATLPFNGPPQDLAAYVVLRPDAYSGEVKTQADLRERLADRLRTKLPTFIVPAYIEFLDSLPTLPSGKTDRKLLPLPRSERIIAIKKGNQKMVPPANDMEKTVAKAWSAVFGGAELSVEADFFLDLGGHSLFAAQCISALRKVDPSFASLSVADLYGNPTIRTLADHIQKQGSDAGEAGLDDDDMVNGTPQNGNGHEYYDVPVRKQYSSCRIWMCGLVQFLLIFLWSMAMTGPVMFLILRYRRLKYDLEWGITLVLLPIIFPVVMKWLLLGKMRAGRHELWSWYYIRFWFVRKCLLFSPISVLAGSPLIGPYLRFFGAKISVHAHVSTPFFGLPDLIQIDEEACVGYQVVLQPFIIEDGWLYIAPIHIQKNAYVGTGCFLMAGAVIGENACLSDQTLVGRNQRIPANENWCGSPARRMASKDPMLAWIEQQPATGCCTNRSVDRMANIMLAFAYIFFMFIMGAMPFAAAVPGVYLLIEMAQYGGFMWSIYFLPVAGVTYFVSCCFMVVVGKYIVLHGLKPGVYPLYSVFAFRKWLSDKMMELSLRMNYSLYSTLYTVPFLRLLGAKIGTWSEVSTVQHIEPDLLTMGNGVFIADMASIGAATFYRGCLALKPCSVGDRTFVGNSAIVRCNTHIPEKCLIGVHSVPPMSAMTPGTSYLGSPSMFLPRRQVVEGFAESTTYTPATHLIIYRIIIEFIRIVMPPILLFFQAYGVWWAVVTVVEHHYLRHYLPHTRFTTQFWLLLYMPIVVMVSTFALLLVVALLKWIIIGRYKKQMVPLWSPFVRHTELVTGIYEGIMVPFLNVFGGSPWLCVFLRIFGAKIGSRVYLDTADITEFDLVEIEDDATVCGPTSLQSHLFEDRIMKMSTVKIRRRANVAARCVVLYDAEVGEDARLEALSLVMKNEVLPPNTSWRGIPSRCVSQKDRARKAHFNMASVVVERDHDQKEEQDDTHGGEGGTGFSSHSPSSPLTPMGTRGGRGGRRGSHNSPHYARLPATDDA